MTDYAAWRLIHPPRLTRFMWRIHLPRLTRLMRRLESASRLPTWRLACCARSAFDWFLVLNAGAKPGFVLFLRHLFALTASYFWHTSATRVPQANQKDLPLHWASLCSASRIPSLLRGHVAMGRPWPNATLAASMRLNPLRNDCTWPAGMGRFAVSGLGMIGWGLLVFGLLVIGS